MDLLLKDEENRFEKKKIEKKKFEKYVDNVKKRIFFVFVKLEKRIKEIFPWSYFLCCAKFLAWWRTEIINDFRKGLTL